MRRPGYLLLFCVLAVISLRAAPSEIGFLPEEKAAVPIDPTERNPFGKRVVKLPETAAVEEKGTEESRIRQIALKLSCSGLVRGGGKTKLLLGSYEVQEGEMVPPLIPNQREKLKVVAIQKDRIDLGFVEKDGSAQTRVITILYDLGPNVRFKLGGPPAHERQEAELGGIIKKNDPASSPQ